MGLVWQLNKGATTIQSDILSVSWRAGRQNYLDDYRGGYCTVTLKNQSNVASNFVVNDVWKLQTSTDNVQSFWVQGVSFTDYPGNTGLSTCTVILADMIARNGRNVVTGVSLAQADTTTQMQSLFSTVGYAIGSIGGVAASSTLSGTTYTGSMSNRLDLAMATEAGFLYTNDVGQTIIVGRNQVSTKVNSTLGFTRNAPTSALISYQQFNRERANMNFYNNVTVTPDGLAAQVEVNTESVTTYGNIQRSITSLDATTDQADGLAQWLAYSQADPATERYSVTFTDVSQNATALTAWLQIVNGTVDDRIMNLTWRVPGAGSDTTTQVLVEGFDVSANPAQTTFTVYFSPASFYQFFTLDSATLGILDTSRLGW
jgi:hypothetical protein